MDSPNPFDDSIGYVNLLNSQQDYLFPPSVAVGSSAVPLFSSSFSNDPTQPEATTLEAATVRGRRNWSPTEDVVLISGWLNTSKEALIGNEQKAEAFWKRIAAYFAASPKLIGLPSREPGNCKQRWAKINDQVFKFVGCLHAANAQKASGQNDNDVMKVANEIYLNDHGAKFTLEHCWRELRNDQKWCLASLQTDHVKSKRRKLDDGSQTSQQSSSCNVDESQPRPLGVKAAKGKEKRSTKSVEQGDKNLTQFQSMWEIRKQDLALKDKLSDKKLLDTLLSKTKSLTEMEMTLKEKLISDMLTG
ncbi:Glutathione S-transferase T3 [Cardamine amara subsp. amara]|uniref:Glutathione S-transferase T3 n=1 Tax=Cardamine amara subsp. amara TaxID=228776 RepID=A0ABD0Z8P1_CARAN